MGEKEVKLQDKDWLCMKCDISLSPGTVNFDYWGFSLPYDLPRCPQCGLVFVSEAMATVQMAEVERTLEDK